MFCCCCIVVDFMRSVNDCRFYEDSEKVSLSAGNGEIVCVPIYGAETI